MRFIIGGVTGSTSSSSTDPAPAGGTASSAGAVATGCAILPCAPIGLEGLRSSSMTHYCAVSLSDTWGDSFDSLFDASYDGSPLPEGTPTTLQPHPQVEWDEFLDDMEVCRKSPAAAAAAVGGVDPADDCDSAPAMPTVQQIPQHRAKVGRRLPEHALVARPVGKKEREHNPVAKAAMKAEWARLRSKNTWDESVIRE